jgi:multidrug efflux pump subunit AcrB
MVVTRLPGAAPEEIETEVTDEIEEAINTISGIDEMRSISSEGVSQVIVTFVLEKDGDIGAQEVREKVSTVLAELPVGTEAPQVMKFDADATPVLYIAVNAPAPLGDVTEVADKVVRRRIESTPGVGQVSVLGGTKRQVNVWLDAERMRAFGLTAVDVQGAILGANLTMPGGRVESGPDQKVLRVRGRVERPNEISDLTIVDRR